MKPLVAGCTKPEVWLRMEVMAYGGEVIKPLSVVAAKESLIERFGTEHYRIGYYGRQDGLNCVRLVNSKGEYEHWLDQRFVLERISQSSANRAKPIFMEMTALFLNR